MNQTFYNCELCNQGIRFRTAKELVSLHYTALAHKSIIASKVNSLQNQDTKLLVLEYLQEQEKKKVLLQQVENQKPVEVIKRKCEICFEIVPEDYEEYVTHILESHNLKIAKQSIADGFIYKCITDGKINKKACEICMEDTGMKVFDYIMHLNLKHKMLINDNLKNYIKDPYVISILLEKDLLKNNRCKNVTICPECGEELDLDNPSEMKVHKEKHAMFKETSKSFHQVESMLSQKLSQNKPEIKGNVKDIIPVISKSVENKQQSKPLDKVDKLREEKTTDTPQQSKFNLGNSNDIDSNEPKSLVNQLVDLKIKIKSLEEEQKKTETQKKNLSETVQKKFSEKDFTMNKVQKQLDEITELDKLISDLTNQIEQLKLVELNLQEKSNVNEKSNYDSDDLKKIERIKELKILYDYLYQQEETTYSDKIHEIEQELIVLQADLEFKKGKFSEIDFSVPKNWSDQKDYLHLHELDKTTEEYSKIEALFLDKSFYRSKVIIGIKRIQNKDLWKNFCYSKYQYQQTKKVKVEEKLLFYEGTTDPAFIYQDKEDGFGFKFASNYGSINFNLNSRRSGYYAMKNKNGNKLIIVANVILGNIIDKESIKDNKYYFIKISPFIPGTKERYDSVKNDDYEYSIFNSCRAYPQYLIEFNDKLY